MQFEFKVPVLTAARPARAKGDKMVLASVSRVVDIPEYSYEDAPLAVRCRFRADLDEDDYQVNFREYRELDGRLYVDLTEEMTSPLRATHGTLQEYSRCGVPFRDVGMHIVRLLLAIPRGERRTTIYPTEHATQFSNEGAIHRALQDLGEMNLVTFDRQAVERCLAIFDREASKLAYIGGRLHAMERAPAIVVSRDHGGVVSAIRRDLPKPLSVYADDSGEWNTAVAYFRIDQAEEALAFAASIPGRFTSEIDDIIVSDTVPVDFDAAAATLHSLAVSMNERVVDFADHNNGRALLDAITPRVAMAYGILETELKKCDGQSISYQLADAVERVIEMGEDERELFIPDDQSHAARAAWDLWQDRPIFVATPKSLAP